MILTVFFLLAVTGQDQGVPEGIYRDVRGPIVLCGMKAADISKLRGQVEKGEWVPANGGSRFDIFDPPRPSGNMIQWIFAKDGEPAYPSVTCRRLFKAADGSLRMEREMRCGGTREACDKLFLEFKALDDSMRAGMRTP